METLQVMDKGNPYATPKALLTIADLENPPLRLNLGSQNLPEIKKAYEQRITIWNQWATLSNSVQN